MSRTFIYIDGFNLYYRALKSTAFKWLDISALTHAVMPKTCNIVQINYYTADISGRTDPTAPARQGVYLKALATLPNVAIHKGRFLVSKKWAGLVQPPDFRPALTALNVGKLDVAHIWKTEEKGSDVNLGVHLVRDAFLGRFDEAAILTNDTDLVEAIRIVRDDVRLPITLLTPHSKPSFSLECVATYMRHIAPYLGQSQFPDVVENTKGRPIRKPASW